MSTSLIEALLIGSTGIVIGIILLSIRHKLHYELYSKKLFNLSIGMILMGVAGGLISYYTTIGYEKNTVIKTKVEGSVGVAMGSVAPVRTLEFTVEHPGVVHELSVKPIDPIMENSFDAEIHLFIINPADEQILSAQQHFVPYAETRSPQMRVKRWRHRDTTFVPQHPGEYTLQVVPVTVNIPEIEIWIRDPQKKDGQRAFSWR